MVHTPVGFRCLECGQGTKLPTYDVSVSYLARAVMASLLIGVAGGLVIVFIGRPLLYGILYIAAMAGYGYLVGEVISVATNRKRGRALQLVAAGGVLVSQVVVLLTGIAFGDLYGLFDLLGAGLATYVAFIRLR